MPIYEIESNGATYEVDAPDEQTALNALKRGRPEPRAAEPPPLAVPPGTKPFQPGLLERGLRYMGEWGQQMRDAASAPGGGPTGIDLIDVPAGIADAALSVASSIPATALGGMATEYRRANGDPNASYAQAVDDYTWAPKTGYGQAALGTLGAVLKPAGDAMNAVFGGAADLFGRAGASPTLQQDIREVVPTLVETALDAGVLRLGGRTARAGTGAARNAAQPTVPNPKPGPQWRGAETPMPIPGGDAPLDAARGGAIPQAPVTLPDGPLTPDGAPLRPFGPEVERARTMGYPLLPSQVAAKAQLNAPVGKFGLSHAVPGTFLEGFTAPDRVNMAAIDSAKRSTIKAQRELGLPEGGAISDAALQMAKAPHNAVFEEVKQAVPRIVQDPEMAAAADAIGAVRRDNPLLSNSPDVEAVRDRLLTASEVSTQDALTAIREYRNDARLKFQQAANSGDPHAEQLAFAYRQAADALESAIERQAGVLYPDLVPRLREARTGLAKIHNVEDALVGGYVDATLMAKLAEKYKLTGHLDDIAFMGRTFPKTNKSAAGLDLPTQSQVGSIWSADLFVRRAIGREQGPRILRDEFQEKFGKADPNYRPTIAEQSPFPPRPTPPSPNVMPPAPGGGPALDAVPLGAVFDELPPAEAFPGDWIAETPGGDAIDLGTELQPPLTDTELLQLQLQAAMPPGPDPRLGDVRPRPLPDGELSLADDMFERSAPVTPDYEVPVRLEDYPAPQASPGAQRSVRLYRGTTDAPDVEGAKTHYFYSPEESIARRYGPTRADDVNFSNLLEVENFSDLNAALGLPQSGGVRIEQLIQRAADMGYDGVSYRLPDGEVEYVKIRQPWE